MYTPPRMPRQHTAVTGRRPNLDNLLRSYIHANIPALRKRIEAAETKEYQERRLGLMERSARMEEEMAAEAAKQGKIATGLSGAQTLGLGYMAHRSGWLGAGGVGAAGGGAAAALTEGVGAPTLTGATAAGAGLSGAQAGATGLTEGIGAPTLTGATQAGSGAQAGAAAPWTAYAGPAAAGAIVGGTIGQSGTGRDVGHFLMGQHGGEREHGAVSGGLSGAAAGALTGAALTSWSGPGAIVGAGIGAVAGAVFGSCIIITAATDPHSYEVNVTREYRDRYLSQQTLRGYYMIAEQIVPLMHKSKLFKRFIKKSLVNHIVRHCEWGIGIRKKRPIISSFITETFLSFCDGLGSSQEYFIRTNGEVW